MTLRELLVDRIATLKAYEERTVEMYCQTLDRFRDFLGHEPGVDDLDDLTVSRFLRWRAKTVHDPRKGIISPASLAKDSAHIRALWTWLAKKRWKKADGELLEFPDYARPKVPKPQPKAYKVDELRLLLAAARRRKGLVAGIPAAWYWTTKLWAMFVTGERIGAILQLRWGQVDLKGGTLTFLAHTRKGKRETLTSPIPPQLAKMMATQQRAPGDLVWPWLEDRAMLSCYASLKVLCKTAGVDYKAFHSIRKSTASYLKKAGIAAAGQLGHGREALLRWRHRRAGVQPRLPARHHRRTVAAGRLTYVKRQARARWGGTRNPPRRSRRPAHSFASASMKML
jgi:integrase